MHDVSRSSPATVVCEVHHLSSLHPILLNNWCPKEVHVVQQKTPFALIDVGESCDSGVRRFDSA